MKYKIAHIARPIAGVGVYIKLLVNNISDSRFENYLLHNQNDQIISIENKGKKRIKKYHINIIRAINPIQDFITLIKLINYLRKLKPDLIHCHSAKAGILGRIAGWFVGVQTVYTPHAFSYLSTSNRLIRFFYLSIEKILAHTPSKILAVSDSEKSRALNDLKHNPQKILVWNNSIPDIISEKTPTILDDIPKKFICAIGRPSYQKNIELLLEVLNEIRVAKPSIHLVLLGIDYYSPEIDNVKRLIQKYKLEPNITLIPWLEREETLAILRQSMIYVSTARYEGLPYALIEALCLAKPCVVTDVDGNKDLVKDGVNGYVVHPSGKLNMATKIISVLDNDLLSQKFSLNSRKIWEDNFNIEKTIENLESIYLKEITN